jgi:hypothetical protein
MFGDGTLVRNGRVALTRPLAQLRLPPTVQGILASRIDRQPARHKRLLQTLAVVGKQSSVELIREIAATPEEYLQQILPDLGGADFVYEQLTPTGTKPYRGC